MLSDIHLGTYGCHAKEVLNYLNSIRPEKMVLNGDIFDIWQFRKRYFPKSHLLVIKKIISLATKGTKVYYITGNHDEKLRRFSDTKMGNIYILDKLFLMRPSNMPNGSQNSADGAMTFSSSLIVL